MKEYDQLKERLVFEVKKGAEAAPPVLKEILYEATACEDCNRIVDEKRVVRHQLYKMPYRHWSQYCSVCQMHKNPITGKFDCDREQRKAIIQALFDKRTK